MKRGIYLVANFNSQEMCENLVYSIRDSGCALPIRIIHFGGSLITSSFLLQTAELLKFEDFSEEAKKFVANLRSVLTDCPLGFLYRFLAWFSDWDQFIYSDNDVVALTNWEEMFHYLGNYDLVHADEEYVTKGAYNYEEPKLIQSIFGELALETAITAGHIVVKRNDKMIRDINNAVCWFKENPGIPKKHDQSLLHIATLLGGWKTLNLCKPPYNWLSSWAGDYKNSLDIIHRIQTKQTRISHIHYSGGTPGGNLAVHELLFSKSQDKQRLKKLASIGIRYLTGVTTIQRYFFRARKKIINKIGSTKTRP